MAHYDNKNFTRKDVVNISLDTNQILQRKMSYLIMLELKKNMFE